VVPPRVVEVVPDRTDVEDRGVADVDVAVGCVVGDDDVDVEGFGTAVVVVTCLVDVVLGISLTVVAGDGFDTP
jgi:hypothetical protein